MVNCMLLYQNKPDRQANSEHSHWDWGPGCIMVSWVIWNLLKEPSSGWGARCESNWYPSEKSPIILVGPIAKVESASLVYRLWGCLDFITQCITGDYLSSYLFIYLFPSRVYTHWTAMTWVFISNTTPKIWVDKSHSVSSITRQLLGGHFVLWWKTLVESDKRNWWALWENQLVQHRWTQHQTGGWATRY